MRGRVMSSTNVPRPVSRRGSSTRWTLAPVYRAAMGSVLTSSRAGQPFDDGRQRVRPSVDGGGEVADAEPCPCRAQLVADLVEGADRDDGGPVQLVLVE